MLEKFTSDGKAFHTLTTFSVAMQRSSTLSK